MYVVNKKKLITIILRCYILASLQIIQSLESQWLYSQSFQLGRLLWATDESRNTQLGSL
jgi:hypothetical protein